MQNTGNFFVVTTFSNVLFEGNPTPVCILDYEITDTAMESYAKEFGMPVAVFVHKPKSEAYYSIRYFTVRGEIPACGHGTLAAADVLFNRFGVHGSNITFRTIEGIDLKASKEKDVAYIEYPRYGLKDFDITSALMEALNIDAFQTHFFCEELESLFIELEEEENVRQLRPDFHKLKNSSKLLKEVVVMCSSQSDTYDFTLRSFCPWIGINEDPVTGSIHSVLGHYWGEKLKKDKLIAYQASERGGKIYVSPLKNSVKLGGNVKFMFEGTLHLES
ncbi:PhzF family phenazine biosynthesis protein [Flagellimonas meridianipacifica]|uniref:PhzF family phenazine biosynthesis protein n=1 Tax=Flagellimonas meridianipacifica TaxID=1080225 RepID=A0A2T0MBK4_9FLAO|nr:PhzF family phenazine biosynthesis protein [Allomuricauda pacifica]PRX54881.1 PhzF family phenazine biosynthesis protein [Allomuricauda pacifica]